MLVGVDLVKTDRWKRILERRPSMAEKIFTEEERKHCESRGAKKAESYAALWGVREAAGKALGIGVFSSGWQDAHVIWTSLGAPVLRLQGNFAKRARELGVTEVSVSMTHEDNMAAAVVVMNGGSYYDIDDGK